MTTWDSTLTETLQSGAVRETGNAGADTAVRALPRPEVRGKFLFIGERKLWIKGVCYDGPPEGSGPDEAAALARVDREFAGLAERGVNAISMSHPPSIGILDRAARHGIRVMVGLSWAHHAAFLDDPSVRMQIIEEGRASVRAYAGHPAVICYTLGKEIPASLVRWHGRRAVESFLADLCDMVRDEDPGALITYTNTSSTEYLALPFVDFYCFSVRLDSRAGFAGYIARLQNRAGEKPLLLTDVDSDNEALRREDLDSAWRIRAAFAGGCAGTFARISADTSDVQEKTCSVTAAIESAYAEVPFPRCAPWPKITVVVCSYNGEPTIKDTLDGLMALEYPDFEVIVVNDGSTDATPQIAAGYPFRLISTENRGLSNARNTGWKEAGGQIVAYIDDDAWPDPHWLHFLAYVFMTSDYVGVGGPNIAPPGDGPIADCVANAPGGPVHVLISDTEAEHIPGCNMSFRRANLAAVDGFDPRYRAAGDDVDLCWRLQGRGWQIGFHPSAVVWHHRRNSVKMYWKQQQGYGKAEALLEEKWPEKYNSMGHYSWSGRLYGKGLTRHLSLSRSRIYEPRGNVALPAAIVEPQPNYVLLLPLMPEWFLLVAGLAALTLLGLSWSPLFWLWPALLVAVGLPFTQAILSASGAVFPTPRPHRSERLQLRAVTAVLHILQPIARLKGRLAHGLTPWRSRLGLRPQWRWRDDYVFEHRDRAAREALLEDIADAMRSRRVNVRLDKSGRRWDMEFLAGVFGRARLAIDDRPQGTAGVRLRGRSRVSVPAGVAVVAATLGLLAAISSLQGAALSGAVLGGAALALVIMSYRQCAAILTALAAAIREADPVPAAYCKSAADRKPG